VLLAPDENAKCVSIKIPKATNNIKFNIGSIEPSKIKWTETLLMKGWAFNKNIVERERNLYLILKSEKNTLVFKIENDSILRPGVTSKFKLKEGIHNHGFMLNLPTYYLTEDIYKVGFMIEDSSGINYSSSNIELLLSEDNVWWIYNPSSISTPQSKQVEIKIKESNYELDCNFDMVKKSSKNLHIKGWAFLKGSNTNAIRTYILLKKDNEKFVFSVKKQTRKDVTKNFKNKKINLDKSGFLAQIPLEKLDRGKYQIGLYIVKGKQTGLFYTDKYINVDYSH
jgi:hypothetical protein